MNFCTFTQNCNGLTSWSFEIPASAYCHRCTQAIMRRIVKISLIAILSLGLYQTSSYLLVGKRNIEVCYFKHFSPLIQDLDKLQIVSTTELNTHTRHEIQETLKPKFNVIGFTNDTALLYKHQYDKEITLIIITVDYKFPFHAVVYENLRTSDYIEVWKSDLDWFFGKWVLRQKINIGQT